MSNRLITAAFAYQVAARAAEPGEDAPPAPSAVKFVLVALADHADDRGLCWPGVWRLTMFTQLSERTVQRCLAELVKLGAVKIRAYRTGGRKRATEYVLTLPVSELSTGNPQNPQNPVDSAGFEGENPVTVTPLQMSKGVSLTQKGVSLTEKGVRATPQPPEPPDNQRREPADAVSPGRGRGVGPRRPSRPSGLAGAAGSDFGAESNGRLTGGRASVAPLIAGILAACDPTRTLAGYDQLEVTAALEKLGDVERRELNEWARVQERRGVELEVIRRGVAVAVMRGVVNPFAYFAPGSKARAMLETD